MSSGESELYAALKAAAEGLGTMSVLSDLGWFMKGEIWGDASAALGIINRRGLGKKKRAFRHGSFVDTRGCSKGKIEI